MKLGIPTLLRYDLLQELLLSAEAGSLVPDQYLIVDNGGGFEPPPQLAHKIRVISPGYNLGVAASWNLMLDDSLLSGKPIVITNDDVKFGVKTFGEMVRATAHHDFVQGDGWALFAQTPECTSRVGFYDENFYPAYYEDVDYDLRLARAGIVPFHALSEPVTHTGWATHRALSPDAASWLQQERERNHQYFLSKWGGESRNPRWNGHPGIFQYPRPFNGDPPPMWEERKKMALAAPMRWDVLNFIAHHIRAKRYLEIGVSDGTCMRRIEVEERWGVDPNPQDAAVRAASVFCATSSERFFKMRDLPEFDLIFIDGNHIAEEVFAEVESARRLLAPHGVICLHDCNPHTEEMQRVPWQPGEWTGDVWRTVVRLRTESARFAVSVVPSDYGVAILHRSDDAIAEQRLVMSNRDWRALVWDDLVRERDVLLGTIRLGRWMSWIRENVTQPT